MTKHVTSKGPKSAFLPKMKSYLCCLSKSCIYTSFFLRAIVIATKSTSLWLILVCLAFKWLISNVNRQRANLLSVNTLYVSYFTVPLKATLFIVFFWVTDAGQTMAVTTCFIVCHAEAHFCASKSCVATGAVLLVGRYLARHQLKKANWCWCFCDRQ